jgi:hypothetical protein
MFMDTPPDAFSAFGGFITLTVKYKGVLIGQGRYKSKYNTAPQPAEASLKTAVPILIFFKFLLGFIQQFFQKGNLVPVELL